MVTALLSSHPEEAPDPRVNVRAGHSKIQASGEIAALQTPGFAFGGTTQRVLERPPAVAGLYAEVQPIAGKVVLAPT
jgi:hypothetical protein